MAVDCQQLKQAAARSAGCSVACNDFIPTAYVRNMMMCGGTWYFNLDVGGEMVATGCVARIWEEDDSMQSMNSTPGRPTPSSSTAAALFTCTSREL